MTYEFNSYPTNYLKCRTFGHQWDEFVPVGKRGPEFGFRFSLLCITCGMERHDIVNSWGRLLTREYVQPEDYQLDFSLTRDDARVEYEKRSDRKVARRGSIPKAIN